ncbi:MAG TPA: zinc-ribbon domain-containing protein, partial [Burkholderiaceae bacterium]|nr:zinc-ribbon domain-containing protein [Burkholderiaceae bacterium]
MSLATRCPVCQTVFRVVQDQLKVSEGWVRCGRCAKVFNAFEGLFDLEREFPALRSPTPSQKVLEDLATRNRQPKQPADWPDDFDTGTGTRAVSQPVSPATSRTASPATVPHVSVPRTPAPAPAPVPSPTPPSPVVPPVPAPSVAMPAPSTG